jgi:hypothetical protein
MNDLFAVFMFFYGLFCGYLMWAPLTPFKQGVIDGMTFKFLWRKK